MPLHRDEVTAFVLSVLVEVADVDIDSEIDPNTPVGPQGLDIESIGMLEIVAQVEGKYGSSIPDAAIERMLGSTFSNLIDEVVKYTVTQSAQDSQEEVKPTVTAADIRTIVREIGMLPEVDTVDDDAQISFDSFSLAWLRHILQNEYGIALDLRDIRAEDFSTIAQIRDYLNLLVGTENPSGVVQ